MGEAWRRADADADPRGTVDAVHASAFATSAPPPSPPRSRLGLEFGPASDGCAAPPGPALREGRRPRISRARLVCGVGLWRGRGLTQLGPIAGAHTTAID